MSYPPPERRRQGPLNRFRRKVTNGAHGAQSNRGNIDVDPDVFMAVLLVVVLLLGTLVTLALRQQSQIVSQQKDLSAAQVDINVSQRKIDKQQEQLSKVEERDRFSTYQAGYRFCSRININRAVLHWFASASGAPNEVTRAYLRRLERKDGAPILDCDPNVNGKPATYRSVAEQRKYVDRWVNHQLTPAEIGICLVEIGGGRDPGQCGK